MNSKTGMYTLHQDFTAVKKVRKAKKLPLTNHSAGQEKNGLFPLYTAVRKELSLISAKKQTAPYSKNSKKNGLSAVTMKTC